MCVCVCVRERENPRGNTSRPYEVPGEGTANATWR